MRLVEYLNAREERREVRHMMLVEQGLDWRSLLRESIRSLEARFLIAASVIGLFAAAFFMEGDKDTRNLMVGALIAAFAGAWGFYLGSSSSASKADDRADAGMLLAQDAVKRLPPPPPEIPDPLAGLNAMEPTPPNGAASSADDGALQPGDTVTLERAEGDKK